MHCIQLVVRIELKSRLGALDGESVVAFHFLDDVEEQRCLKKHLAGELHFSDCLGL